MKEDRFPAFNAGIRGRHYIGSGDGFISNMNNFYRVINEYEPGTEVVFKVKGVILIKK